MIVAAGAVWCVVVASVAEQAACAKTEGQDSAVVDELGTHALGYLASVI